MKQFANDEVLVGEKTVSAFINAGKVKDTTEVYKDIAINIIAPIPIATPTSAIIPTIPSASD